jgi:hypothetical protein
MTVRRVWIVFAAFTVAALACNLPGQPAPTPQPVRVTPEVSTPPAGTGNTPGLFDGGDGLDTIPKGALAIGGEAGSGNLDSWFNADNWTFDGSAGQQVTILVESVNGSDPNLALIDPQGNVIGEDDDSGDGTSAQLVIALPANGTYTIRIDIFTPGDYNVSVK